MARKQKPEHQLWQQLLLLFLCSSALHILNTSEHVQFPQRHHHALQVRAHLRMLATLHYHAFLHVLCSGSV